MNEPKHEQTSREKLPFGGMDFGVDAFASGEAKTRGEKSFDRWVYIGNNYFLNLLLSSAVTYFVHDNVKGQRIYRGLQTFYTKAGVKNPALRDTLSKAFTIMIGGHATGAIVKKAEDNKLDLVRWFDKGQYGDNIDDVPELQAAYHRIAEESSPTWPGIIAGRFVNWATIQATAMMIGSESGNLIMNFGKKRNIPGMNQFSVDGWSAAIGKRLANATPSKIEHAFNTVLSPLASHNKDEVFGKLITYVATDTLYTAVTAATLKPVLEGLAYIPGMRHYPNAGLAPAPKTPVAEETRPAGCPACPACECQTKPKTAESSIILPKHTIHHATPQGLVHPATGQQITPT